MSIHKKRISIVAPFYNEGSGVDTFNSALSRILDDLPDFELEGICVDDGSTGDTLEKPASIAGEDRRFNIIKISRNFGKEAALTAGIDFATGDAVIPFDADLQLPLYQDSWNNLRTINENQTING